MTTLSGEHDPVIAALDSLAIAVDESEADSRQLKRNLAVVRGRRLRGRRWSEIIGDESTPGTLALLGRILARLGNASGAFRRALARDLRAEGESVTGIARLFGVTHQRTSALLRANEPEAEGSVSS